MVNETSFEIEGKRVMEGSRKVLVKIFLFQSAGRGLPKDGARHIFFLNSKSSIIGLCIDV